MKRAICLLAATLFAATLAACGPKEESATATTPGQKAEFIVFGKGDAVSLTDLEHAGFYRVGQAFSRNVVMYVDDQDRLNQPGLIALDKQNMLITGYRSSEALAFTAWVNDTGKLVAVQWERRGANTVCVPLPITGIVPTRQLVWVIFNPFLANPQQFAPDAQVPSDGSLYLPASNESTWCMNLRPGLPMI